ncbi:MAG: hypothetical protein AMJ65_01855 [Phycisphaerae bacterium SG8_4]|nr:MAG: hypothetical protein AMJ65_01855 [Phycisphaerae bacterium SG8_4]
MCLVYSADPVERFASFTNIFSAVLNKDVNPPVSLFFEKHPRNGVSPSSTCSLTAWPQGPQDVVVVAYLVDGTQMICVRVAQEKERLGENWRMD